MADYYAWWTMEGVDELDAGWAENLCDAKPWFTSVDGRQVPRRFWATGEGGAAQSGLAGGCRGVHRLCGLGCARATACGPPDSSSSPARGGVGSIATQLAVNELGVEPNRVAVAVLIPVARG